MAEVADRGVTSHQGTRCAREARGRTTGTFGTIRKITMPPMSLRLARIAILTISAITALAAAQPALAYTELGTTGTVGQHSLLDTHGTPGGACKYKFSSFQGAWKLKKIYVEPPLVRAVPGQGTERVGWKFKVQRQIYSIFLPHPLPWKTRYTSPIFTAYTNSSTDAAFSEASVKVKVPFGYGEDAFAAYRVIVKIYWYKPNGHILGTATERVGWYENFAVNGGDTFIVEHPSCPDYS